MRVGSDHSFWLIGLLAWGCARAPAPADQQHAPATSTLPSPAADTGKQPEPVRADQAAPPAANSAAPPPAAPVAPGAPKAGKAPAREQLPEKKKSADDFDQGAGRGASGLPGPKSQADDLDAEGLFAELGASFNRLDLALSAPDCVTAAVFRDRVCELSERICRLADERPSSSTTQHCGDGRARCTDARRRFASGCPTP